jgi:hypothetical protein
VLTVVFKKIPAFCYVRQDDWYRVTNVSKGCVVFIFRILQSRKAVGLLDIEDEGITLIRNVGDTYPHGVISHTLTN